MVPVFFITLLWYSYHCLVTYDIILYINRVPSSLTAKLVGPLTSVARSSQAEMTSYSPGGFFLRNFEASPGEVTKSHALLCMIVV